MANWLRTAWNSSKPTHSKQAHSKHERDHARKQRRKSDRRRQLQQLVESLEQRVLLAGDAGMVSLEETRVLADHAAGLWASTGITSEQLDALENLTYQVADLGENLIGQYRPGVITIDDNAGGSLWFVDQTPTVNEEFTEAGGQWIANESTLAAAKMDLLTVLLHEQGHALGLEAATVDVNDVMADVLQSGRRRLPTLGQADGAIPGSLDTVENLTSANTGGGQFFDARAPFGTVNYVIATQGLFPSRNLSDGEPFLGRVDMFAGNFAPRGYALAEGQLLSISSNQSLFSLLGTTYGGDGRTTFALPDLRGRVPIGRGQGPGLANYALGQKGGTETVTLTTSELPSHSHTVTGSQNSTDAGGDQPVEYRTPFLAMTPVVTMVGTFPSRSLGTESSIGSVSWFAGNFAPRGYLEANGQLLPISQNTALFSLYGTTFGGDGRTTFGLPDLRGRAAVHAGNGSGPGLSRIRLGQKGGEERVTLTTANLPSHNHAIDATNPTTTGLTGGNQAFDNRSPFLGLNYNISLVGVFPSRSLATDDDDNTSNEETIGSGFVSGNDVLDESDALPLIDALVEEGIRRWALAGIDGDQVATLEAVRVELRDLASGRLAAADVDVITLDRDASNRGWYIDATPTDDVEFGEVDPRTGELVGSTEASRGHYDLLTAIMHEQGHILGLEHAPLPGQLMYGGLSIGSRTLATSDDLVLETEHEDHDDPEYLQSGGSTIAAVGMFGGNFNPRGWAFTDGQLLSVGSNDALFSLIGTIYGGDGRSTFALPELRGREVIGAGNGPGLSSFREGQKGGRETVTLLTNQMPSHAHTVALPVSTPVANNDNGPDLDENGDGESVDILANDTDPNRNPTAPVNAFDRFSVDLDQATDGVQTVLTVADEGEWFLDNISGFVTFTPATGFDGRATIVYTLTDTNGSFDKANITFAVRAASGDIVVNLPAGGGTTDLVIDGTDIVVRRGGTEFSRTPIATTTRLTINGTDADNDTLNIDLSNGNPIPSGGLHFDGGVGGDDALAVTNGGEIDSDYDTSGEQAGELEIDGGVVTFSNLEPLDYSGSPIGSMTITVDPDDLTGSVVTTTISAKGANTLVSFDVTSGLESLELGVVNGTLTIDLDATDIDVVNIEGLGTDFAGNLIINGDVLDTVNVLGAVDMGTDSLTISGNQINVYQPLQSTGGDISLTADVVDIQDTVNVGAGNVTIAPLTPGSTIDLGGQVGTAASKVYWTDANQDHIRSADVSGVNVNVATVVSATGSTPNLSIPNGIGVDSATGQVYFSDTGNDFIGRADLVGLNSNVQNLVDPIALSNDVTVAGGHLYWIDSDSATDHIIRADLDGSNQEILVDGLDSPQGIAVDVAGGKVYWSDSNDDHIQRADINGDLASNNLSKEDVVTAGPTVGGITPPLQSPQGIALDLVNRKIYFVDGLTTDKIFRADMDGPNLPNSNVEEVVNGLSSPRGIAVDPIGGKVYWSDTSTGFDHIRRADITGGVNSNVEDVVTGLATPNHIDLLFAASSFTLSDAQLDLITAGTLTIGDADSGNVTITADVSPANVMTLGILSGGTVAVENPITLGADGSVLIDAGDLIVSAAIAVSGSGEIELRTAELLDLRGSLTAVDGNISLISESTVSNSMRINGPIASNGELLLAPTSMRFNAGGTPLTLVPSNLTLLQDGFSQIRFGDAASGTEEIDIRSASFTDPVTLAGDRIVAGSRSFVFADTNAVTFDGDLFIATFSHPGILQVTGNVMLTGDASFGVEIDGTTPGTTNNEHSQLEVIGSVDLGGATLNVSGDHWPTPGDSFTIIDNDGTADAVIGTFAGLPEGATVVDFLGNGLDATISYVGGDGNDVVLTTENFDIIGYKFDDANGNGIDDNDLRINGVQFYIDANNNSQLDPNEATATSRPVDINFDGMLSPEEQGIYGFRVATNVAHQIREVDLGAGILQTTEDPAPITLAANEFVIATALISDANDPRTRTDVDLLGFGNVYANSISGYKFDDLNSNGLDDDEPRLPGVSFTLTGVDVYGNMIDETLVTDADGEFEFKGLLPSEAGMPTRIPGQTATGYTVTETVPNGYVATTPTVMTTDLQSGHVIQLGTVSDGQEFSYTSDADGANHFEIETMDDTGGVTSVVAEFRGTLAPNDVTIPVPDGSLFSVGDFIRIGNNEIAHIRSINGNTLSALRGQRGTTAVEVPNGTVITRLSTDLPSANGMNAGDTQMLLRANASTLELDLTDGLGDFFFVETQTGTEVIKVTAVDPINPLLLTVERGLFGTDDAVRSGPFVVRPVSVGNPATVVSPSGDLSETETTITVDNASEFAVGRHLVVGNEAVLITGINGDEITVMRGQLDSTAGAIPDGAAIAVLTLDQIPVYVFASDTLVDRTDGMGDTIDGLATKIAKQLNGVGATAQVIDAGRVYISREDGDLVDVGTLGAKLLGSDLAFGNFELGSIQGVKFLDLGEDGFAGSDPFLGGVKIDLWQDGGDGLFDQGAGDDVQADSATTDATDGTYQFDDLPFGTYFVAEDPAGLQASGQTQSDGGDYFPTAPFYTVEIFSGTVSTGNDFANTAAPLAFIDVDGNLVLTDPIDGRNDKLTIVVDGANYRISDLDNRLAAGNGVTQDGDDLLVPIASVTGEIQVNTLGGDDTMTIDRTGGGLQHAVVFDGGTGGVDELAVISGNATNAMFDFVNEHDGSIQFDAEPVITYVGLEPITSTVNATNVILNYSGADETITVTDAPGGQTTVDSTAGEIATFDNPTGLLIINAGDGTDAINVDSLASNYPASITIDGQGGTDTLNLNTEIDTDGNDVDLTAETVSGIFNIVTDGGDVTVSALAGITTGGINTGTNTGDAGSIALQAEGDISTGVLQANASGAVAGSVGGDIIVFSGSGSVTTNNGLISTVSDGDGGLSGNIDVLGFTGISAGDVSASAANPNAGGGTGGSVSLTTFAGSVNINLLSSGGLNGGEINVFADGDINVRRILTRSFDGIGGNVNVTSASGSITVDGGNNGVFTFGELGGGLVFLEAPAGVNVGEIDTGADAGPGGPVDVFSNAINISGEINSGGDVLGGPISFFGDGTIDGVIAGNGAVNVFSTNTLTFTGDNTYTGATTIFDGVLALSSPTNNNISDSSIIELNGGDLDVTDLSNASLALTTAQVLRGNGNIMGSVIAESGSSVSPGFGSGSFGTLTTSMTSAVELGGSLDIEIESAVAGIGHSQWVTNGYILIGDLNLSGTGAGLQPGDEVVLIDNQGTFTQGPFDGLPEGTVIPDVLGTGLSATITYVGGDGNDVSLLLDANVSVDGAGNLIIEDPDGSRNDDITIEIDAPNYRITDSVNGLTAGSGSTQDGPNSILVPIASVTGEIQVTTGSGDDTLTVDHSGGIITDEIVLDGGAGGNDDLVVTGGAFGTGTLSFANQNDGSVNLDGSVITYTGLEPIDMSGTTVDDLVLNFVSASGETITLSDDPGAGDGVSRIDSTQGELLNFPTPNNSLTITTTFGTGAGVDVVNVEGLDSSFDADLTITAEGDDTVNFQSNPTDIGSGNLVVASGSIDFGSGSISTTGNVSLTASSVTDNDAAVDITADVLTIATPGDVGAAGAGNGIDTSVDRLFVDSSANHGSQWFNEADGLAGLQLLAGSGNVNLTSGGPVFDSDPGLDIVAATGTFVIGDGVDGADFGTFGNPIGTDLDAIDIDVTGTNSTGSIETIEANTVSVLAIAADLFRTRGGTFVLSNSDVISDETRLNLRDGSTFDLNDHSETVQTIFALGANSIDLGSGTLTMTHANNFVQLFEGVISGTGSIVQQGGGLLTLTSVNTYTGSTSVEGGELGVSGTITGAGVSISSGAELSNSFGAGTVDAPVTGAAGSLISAHIFGSLTLGDGSTAGLSTMGMIEVEAGGSLTVLDADTAELGSSTIVNGTLTAAGGISLSAGNVLSGEGSVNVNPGLIETNAATIAPGNSPGILSTGNISIGDDSSLEIEIGGATAGSGAGFHDQLNVTGTVAIGNNVTLDVSSFGGFTASSNDQFIIVNNDAADPVTGTFDGLPEGFVIADFLGSSLSARISYVGGDGNDVALSVFPNVSVDAGGNLIIDDPNGTRDDEITIVIDGANYRITDTVNGLSAGGGATQDSQTSITVPIASVTGEIRATTRGGDDTLTVDYDGGNFASEIVFDGGLQNNSDTLAVTGGPLFADAIFNYRDSSSGSIDLTDNALLTYDGLEPIASTINATNVTLNYLSGGELITISDNAGQTQAVSTLGELTTFNNPAGSLTINTEVAGGFGLDTISLQGVGAGFDADLFVFSGNDDTLEFQNASTNIGAGDLLIESGNVLFGDGDLVTTGDAVVTASAGSITTGNFGGIDLTASSVVFSAVDAVGAPGGGGWIDTQVSNLEGIAGAGGFFVWDAGDLIVGGISPGVGVDTDGGDIVLYSVSGNLTINETVDSDGGDIELETGIAQPLGGDIAINAAVLSGGGMVDVEADNNVTFSAIGLIDTEPGSTAAVNVSSDFGGITMVDGSLINAWDGAVRLSANTNIVSPAGMASSDLIAGASLTLNGRLTVGGINTGSLRVAGNVAFDPAAPVDALTGEVNGPTPGIDHDQLVVTGTVDLTGSDLNLSGTITSNPSQAIVLIDNDDVDAIAGTFNGLPDGATVNINGIDFILSYQGGADFNDVVLYEPGPVAITGDATSEDFELRRLTVGGGDQIQLLRGGVVIDSRPAASVTQYTINGGGGADSLEINYNAAGGGFAFDVTFDGQGGTDSLTINGTPIGTPLDTVKYNYGGSDLDGFDGTVELDPDGTGTSVTTVTFDGLAPLTNSGDATNVIFNLPNVVNADAVLQNNAAPGMNELIGSTFENTVFNNPLPGGSLTVNLGDQGDQLNVNAFDAAYAAALSLNGGAGIDTIDASLAPAAVAIDGGAEADILIGSAFADTIIGGDGNDTITGGLGADIQLGDAGNDTFVWNNGDGPDDNTGGADTDTFTFNGADGADDILTLNAGIGDGSLAAAAFNLARTFPSAFTIEGVEIENVNINGLAGADHITVVPSGILNVAVDGGDPTMFPGDRLTVGLAGTTGASLDVTGPRAGEFSFTSAHNDITYSDIELVDAVNGTFSIGAINTGAGDDDIVLRLDGGDTVVTVGGAEFFRAPSANITDLAINGQDGNDTFTVDYVNGNPIPAGGVFFNGNGQNAVGGDSVVLQNGTVTTVHHQFTNNNDGSVDIDSSLLTYTGLEPITDNLNATNRIFTFNGGNETITLADDGTANDNVSLIDSTLGESVTFVNPTNSLTVNSGTDVDIIEVNTLDAMFAASLVIDGGDSAGDTLTMTGVNLINTPGRGLALNELETISITGGTISGNTAPIGGGLLIDNSTAATTTATLSGVTISGNAATGGTAPLQGGGGLYNNGAVLNVIGNSVISGNTATVGQGSGGGILSTGTLTITDSMIVDNDANRAGGGIEIAAGSGLTTLTDVNLDRNDALAGPGNGGGLHVTGAGDVSIVRGTVADNTAASEGGGLWNDAGTMSIDSTMITGNVASGDLADNGGGGVFNVSGVLDIDNATIRLNQADGVRGSGGGVFSQDGSVTIDNSTIESNSANRAGGGIEVVAGTMTLTNVNLNGNDVDGNGASAMTPNPGNGGGLHVTGAALVTVVGGQVNQNRAREEGGGLWNSTTGTMIIDGVTIDGNLARAAAGGTDQGGGGVFNDGGVLTIRNNTSITNNLATDNLGNGGGVMTVGGIVTIDNSTLTGNRAARAGGGIENNAGNVTLTDVTVGGPNVADGNTAGINGGGLHAGGAASFTVVDGGLFQNNVAQQEGGGLWNGTGTMTIRNNTTITQNTAVSADNAGNDQGGGGVFNIGGTLDIDNAMITENLATANDGNGGGVMTVGGTVTIDDSSIQTNQAARAGGGIENNDGIMIVTNETVGGPAAAVGNIAGVNGGGLHASGINSVTTVNGGLFQNNVAGQEGGGLWNGSGAMTINGTQILDNTANSGDNGSDDQGGGGVFNINGTLDIDNATITGNLATANDGNGGGVMTVNGTVTIDDTVIQANQAARAGGGIENNNGNVTLTGVTVGGPNAADGNTAGINGGGLHASGAGSVTIVDGGSFQYNIAGQEGGGLWNGPGTMTIRNNTTITQNTANSTNNGGNDQGGGGVFNIGGTLDIDDATITENLATANDGNGGGVMTVGGNVTIDNTFVGSNQAGRDGGGLHASETSDVTVTGGTFRLNTAEQEGGGLWNGPGTMTVRNGTVITENTANSADNAGNDQGGGGVFNIGGTLDIDDANITNNLATAGNGNGGGVMTVGGTVTIDVTTIANNDAARAGGGIENNNGNVSLTNVTLGGTTAADGNTAGVNGGGLHASGTSVTTIQGGSVQRNVAEQEGGGLWIGADSTMSLDDVLISFNTANSTNAANDAQGGGGVFSDGGLLAIRDGARIENNTALDPDGTGTQDDGGGGVFNNGGVVTVTGATTVLRDNSATDGAGNGGGIMNLGGELTIEDATLAGNAAARAGGGVENNGGVLTLKAATFGGAAVADGNSAGVNGGGVHASGQTTNHVEDGLFQNNTAGQEGGGLWNSAVGTMSITGTTIQSNTASGPGSDQGGGGVFNAGGVLDITGATISGNIADGTSGSGGGVLNDATGSLSVTNSTIEMNQANRAGGGIETTAGTTNTLTNVNLDNNNAGMAPATANPGNGGGLHVSNDADVTITGGSVSGNTAAREGGGLWNGGGTLIVTNTNVNNNRADGTATDQGGGGVFNEAGIVSLLNVQLNNNEADFGAAAFNNQGTLNVRDSQIMNNTDSGLHYVNIAGVLAGNTVSGNTAGGVTGLVGTAGNDVVRITSTSIEINGSVLNYDGNVDAVSISTGDGNDTIEIRSTSAGSPITIDTGDGDDVISIASDAPDNRGSLNGIEGDINIMGGANGNATVTESVTARNSAGSSATVSTTTAGGDLLQIIDAASSSSNTYSLTGTTFQRTGTTATGVITFGGVESLEIQTGLGSDAVNVSTTPDNGIVTLRSGAGDDSVMIDNTGANGILRLATERGDDNVAIGSTGQASVLLVDTGDQTDTVTINDRGAASGVDIRTGQGSDNLTIGDAVTPANVGANPAAALFFDGGANDDTFNINEVFAASVVEVVGGAGNDTFHLNAASSAGDGTLGRLNDTADSRQLLIGGGANDNAIRTFYEGIVVSPTDEKVETQVRNQDVGDTVNVNATSATGAIDFNYRVVAPGEGILSTGTSELLDSLGIETINLHSGAGNDSLTVTSDIAFGIEASQQAITFDGGAGGNDQLTVTGTDEADRITVGPITGDTTLEPIEVDNVESVTISGNDGNDQLSSRLAFPANIDGGTGDNILLGGFAIDVLRVGAGESLLFGRLEGNIVPQRGEGEIVYDVNRDGRISAIDPLRVINELNSLDRLAANGEFVVDQSVGYITHLDDADVNADGKVSALDALMIINLLNSLDASSHGVIEAEAVQAHPSAAGEVLPSSLSLDPESALNLDALALNSLESKAIARPAATEDWSSVVDQAFDLESSESDDDTDRAFWDLANDLF